MIVALVTVAAASTDLDCKSSPCMYGICVDEPNSFYRCYCIDGYTGVNCEINWDECWSNPCLNAGTCHDAVAAYNCTCPDGFVGVNCEQRYSECMSQPCLNNGTCLDSNAGVTCQCLEGFSGEFCEMDASVCNGSVCKNSAECVEGPGLSFSCRCADGWFGRFCEEDVNECTARRPACQNGGLCINLPGSYQCACLFGFTGKHCDKLVVPCDDNPCENSAVCLLEDGQPVCYCVPDYHGLLCESRYDDCQSKYARCENGGSCVDGIDSFTCSCTPLYTGHNCAVELALPPTSTEPASTELATSTELALETSSSSSSSSVPILQSRTEYDEAAAVDTEPPPTTTTTAIASAGTSDFELSTVATESARASTTSTRSDASSPSATASTRLDTSPPPATTTTSSGLSEGSTDADVDETISSNLTTFSLAETTTSISPPTATAPAVVTMLPSSIFSSAATTTSLSSTSSAWASMTPPSLQLEQDAATVATNISADNDFTSVSDFHRTTFGSDIHVDASSTLPTIDHPTTTLFVHACTTEQCANTTRCTPDASQCDCSYRDNCRMRPSVSNAAFNGKSYIRQKFSIDSGSLSIFLRLKTKANSGILIHALFDDERYVLLYMETGQLKFQFSCGLQTMLFGELDSPVNNGYEVDLEMRFKYIIEEVSDRCSARLLVNGTVAMSGEQLLQTHETVPQLARLHLGGIPLAFSHQFPQIVLGFVGCMSLLEVNEVKRDFIHDSIEAVQIEECHSFLCLSSPCKNFGACEELDGTTKCKCIAGYSGQFCERSICDEDPCHLGATCLISPGVNFLCVCPLGAHGLFCERDTTIVQPSFSVFAPGFSSYMAYGVSTSIKDNMELRMRIIPQSFEQISLLAYMGQSGAKRESSDHFSVTYVRGYLMLTWDLGSGVRRIFTSSPINTRAHKVHTLQIGRRGRDSWLYVEGVGNVTGRAAGTNTRLDVSPILYIGGHKTKYFESLPHDLPLHAGFSGCIYDIELSMDDNVFPITMASPATGRGVGECHRNECSHHSCKNGAVCLNYGPTYSCICMKDWQGPDCSSPLNCTSNSCY